MNPRIVNDSSGLLQMLRCQLAEQPHRAAQLTPMISLIESNDDMAKTFLNHLAEDMDWGLGKGVGFFNAQALSSLPFLAVTEMIQMAPPTLLRHARIYGESLGKVKVRGTPDDEVYAKASHEGCCISLGLLNIVYCVLLYLLCLKEDVAQSQGSLLWFGIPDARSRLLRFLDLDLNPSIAEEFVQSNFRSDAYRPFVEVNETLDKLGIKSDAVNACLQQAECRSVLTAFVLAKLSICFITFHELAHHHFGHTHLLEMWRDAPTVAERVMHTGFPSADARRAMESFADVWATEMLIVSETLSAPVVLTRELADGGIPSVTRAKWVYAAIQLTFRILSAVDSVTSRTNAAWEDFLATLNGEIDSMYPGGMSRSAFALWHGPLKAATSYRLLRWTRWRTMRRDLEAINVKELDLAIFLLWPACGLAGGLIDFNNPKRSAFPEDRVRRDGRQEWHAWDRFNFIKAHSDLSEDLRRARKWAAKRV
jgi:hypothetical protein